MDENSIARFWTKVDKRGPDECWPWIGCRNTKGYGTLSRSLGRRGRSQHYLAHRFSWEAVNGPVPTGLYILHSCDNPPCCNPAHLRPGSQQDNVSDMWDKNRQGPRLGVRAEKNPRCTVSDAQVIEIQHRWAAGEHSIDLAKEFCVGRDTIDNYCRSGRGNIPPIRGHLR